MKKLGIILVVLVFTTEAWAVVRILAEDEGGGVVSIKYETDGEKVRAFALDITVSAGTIDAIFDYHVGESTTAEPGYGIFPGSFGRYTTVDPDTGEVVNWDINEYTPVADPYSVGALGGLGTNGITIEMVALYYPPGDSSPNAPPNSGTLCKIRVSEDCLGSICENAARGGVVLTDPSIMPIVDSTEAWWPEPPRPIPHDCFPTNNPAFSDWVAVGKPECWCPPPYGSGYQCDGDADGRTSGFPLNYRVFIGDLALIVENWKKKVDDPTLNPCADIDHKAQTLFKYRVYINDLAVIVRNWKKTDADLPGDCPR
jgi:hypothetical protein